MLKGKDIVIVGQQAWDVEIGSNCKNIASEFSKHNRVLYVNPPLDRITKFRFLMDPKISKRIKIIKGEQNAMEQISDTLWVYYPDVSIESINWLPSHRIFNFFNYHNNKKFARSIRRALRKRNFSDYVLFNDSDMFRSFYLKEMLEPSLSIYYSRDNLLATKYWKKHGVVFEPKIIEKSDLCFANSEYLKNYCRKYNEKAYYVGQGCEIDIFEAELYSGVPDDMVAIKSPIVGYVGALTSARLDIGLIEQIAIELPHWNVVLVGPEDDAFKESKLHSLSNVIFLGPKGPKDLPSYIGAFDVCINPQTLNELTIGNYPRKIDEYLAMGKAVVATKTAAMKTFEDYVSLAADSKQFIEMIELAFFQNNQNLQELRRQFAMSHTWENSVNAISKHINDFYGRKKTAFQQG